MSSPIPRLSIAIPPQNASSLPIGPSIARSFATSAYNYNDEEIPPFGRDSIGMPSLGVSIASSGLRGRNNNMEYASSGLRGRNNNMENASSGLSGRNNNMEYERILQRMKNLKSKGTKKNRISMKHMYERLPNKYRNKLNLEESIGKGYFQRPILKYRRSSRRANRKTRKTNRR